MQGRDGTGKTRAVARAVEAADPQPIITNATRKGGSWVNPHPTGRLWQCRTLCRQPKRQSRNGIRVVPASNRLVQATCIDFKAQFQQATADREGSRGLTFRAPKRHFGPKRLI